MKGKHPKAVGEKPRPGDTTDTISSGAKPGAHPSAFGENAKNVGKGAVPAPSFLPPQAGAHPKAKGKNVRKVGR